MAYQINGNVVIDDSGNGSFTNLPFVIAPVITDPTEGEQFPYGSNIILTASGFSGIYKTFYASQFQVANVNTFAAGNIVFDSGNIIPGNVTVDAGVLSGNLFARVRYISVDNIVSDYSETRSFSAESPPTVIGQSFAGGFYTGTLNVGGTCYYYVVSPNATGCAACQWKTGASPTPGTCDLGNGYLNTYPALANATHPAGNWTATRTISGFTDWYLPSKNEAITLMFTQNMPAGENYSGGRYWTSTECGNTDACMVCMSSQNVNTGNKANEFCPARAVRRVPF